jgi:hypothetical protein
LTLLQGPLLYHLLPRPGCCCKSTNCFIPLSPGKSSMCALAMHSLPHLVCAPKVGVRKRGKWGGGGTLYQERAVFGKMKMDPAKRGQTQNAGEVSWLQWFFYQSVELMTDKVWLHCIRPMLLK